MKTEAFLGIDRIKDVRSEVLDKLRKLDTDPVFQKAMAELAKAKNSIGSGIDWSPDMAASNFRASVSEGLARTGTYETANTAWHRENENANTLANLLKGIGLDATVVRRVTCAVHNETYRTEIEALVQEMGADNARWIGEKKLFFSLTGHHPREEALLVGYATKPDVWHSTVITLQQATPPTTV